MFPDADAPAFSDAARRCSDVVTLHAIANKDSIGRWVAIRLSDGSSDNTVYPERRYAIAAKYPMDSLWCYLRIPPGGMTPKEADIYLDYNRKLYDAGFRMPDPDFAMPMMPSTAADRKRQINALTRK